MPRAKVKSNPVITHEHLSIFLTEDKGFSTNYALYVDDATEKRFVKCDLCDALFGLRGKQQTSAVDFLKHRKICIAIAEGRRVQKETIEKNSQEEREALRFTGFLSGK